MKKVVGFIFRDKNGKGETVVCFPDLGVHRRFVITEQGETKDIGTSLCDQDSDSHENGKLIFGDYETVRKILVTMKLQK